MIRSMSTKSLEVTRDIKLSFQLSCKFLSAPSFVMVKNLIYFQDYRIKYYSDNDRIDHLGNDYMQKIIWKIKSSTHHEQKDITYQSIKDIAHCDKCYWKLYIFREEYITEFSVEISDIHIDQRICAKQITKKDIR